MGVYFIAAGNSSRNREKTLDRSHRVESLVPLVPPPVAVQLREAFPSGRGVHAWGGSDPRHRAVLGLPGGTYVVDVSNADVRRVFRFAFGYRAPDHRIQNHFAWDDHVPLAARRPYPLVYFLRDPVPTRRAEAQWFRRAFGIGHANWLPGQRLFTDAEVARAMGRTEARTVEEFLGIESDGPRRALTVAGEPLVPYARSSRAPHPAPARPAPADSRDGGGAGTGQGYGLTAPERRAVELRAMALAAEHYAGWDEVRDVGATESYDLRCRRGMSELRVEVKGTTGDGASVVLTRNEVDHARGQYPHVALVVVSRIRLEGRGTGAHTATGGEVRVLSPWDVDGAALRPETYRYVLPPR